MLEGRANFGGDVSKNLVQRLTNVAFSRRAVHGGQGVIYGAETELPVADADTDGRRTQECGE
jgi:hypothetical protein